MNLLSKAFQYLVGYFLLLMTSGLLNKSFSQKMLSKEDLFLQNNILVKSPGNLNKLISAQGLRLNKYRRYEITVQYPTNATNEYRYVRLYKPTSGNDDCFRHFCWTSLYLFSSSQPIPFTVNNSDRILFTSWTTNRQFSGTSEFTDTYMDAEEIEEGGKHGLLIKFQSGEGITIVKILFLNSVYKHPRK
jgi:hypothetical protein